jgi:hypothetical protein
MLNVFPDFLAYGFLLGPMLVRVCLGLFVLASALRMWRTPPTPEGGALFFHYLIGGTLFGVGVLLCVGLFTQVAALLSAIIFAYKAFGTKLTRGGERPGYLLATGVSLALLFLGAGAFAFDLSL